MELLSERFEVRLPSYTLETLRRESQKRDVPMSQLVREAIDLLLEQDQKAKMQAADELFSIGAPVANWKQMKDEITISHLKDATDG